MPDPFLSGALDIDPFSNVDGLLSQAEDPRPGLTTAERLFASGALDINPFENIQPSSEFGIAEGFLKGTFHAALPGLFGIEPGTELRRFQDEHPGIHIASELLGFGATLGFAGATGLKLLSKVPRAAKAVATVSKGGEFAARSPKLAAANKEVLRFVPLEMTRIIGAAAFGDEDSVGKVAGAVGIELPFFWALGGVAGALSGALGTTAVPKILGEAKIQREFPKVFDDNGRVLFEYNLNGTFQDRLRGVRLISESGDEVGKQRISQDLIEAKNKLKLRVRLEQPKGPSQRGVLGAPVKRKPWVQPIEGERGGAATALLNSIYRGRTDTTIGHLVAVGTRGQKLARGFKTADELVEFETRAGLFPGWEENAQFARAVTFKGAKEVVKKGGKVKKVNAEDAKAGAKASRSLQEGLNKNMEVIDSRKTWIAKEREGLYTIVKKVKGRVAPPGKILGTADDQFLIIKTDNPNRFFTEGATFNRLLKENAFHLDRAGNQVPTGLQTSDWRYLQSLKKAIPEMEVLGLEPSANSRRISELLTDRQELIKRELRDMAAFTQDAFKAQIAPSLVEFSRSSRASRMVAIARAMLLKAQADTETTFFGRALKAGETGVASRAFGPGTLPALILQDPTFKGGLATRIRQVYKAKINPQEAISQLNEAFVKEMTIAEASAAGFRTEVIDALKALDKQFGEDGKLILDILSTQELTGSIEVFAPRAGHYGISRTWRGEWRIPLLDEAGNKVGYGSGASGRAAFDRGNALIEEATRTTELKFRPIQKDGAFHAGRDRDLALAADINLSLPGTRAIRDAQIEFGRAARTPFRFQERTGALGSITDFSEKELLGVIFSNVLESKRYVAESLIRHEFMGDLIALNKEFPALAKQFHGRFLSFLGKREDVTLAGKFAKLQTDVLDSFLGPVFGARGAEEIVRSINSRLFDLTLGAGDLGFAALNAITPIQTGLPEVSFLLTEPPKRLAQYYGYHVLQTVDGRIKGVGFLEPVKVMRLALKDAFRPSEEIKQAMKLAADRNVISKPFIEEILNKTTQVVIGIDKLKTGAVGFGEYLDALSKFLPAKSEEFSRGIAFLMGRRVGKDFYGLQGEQLFRMAEQFTNRTMFLYTTADRPRIITGAGGTLFGLFKNWTMHYVANMMAYAGPGFLRNNWEPLMWAYGGTFAVGGLGAVPLIGAANQFSKMVSDKPLVQNLYDAFGYDPDDGDRTLADTIYYGLPAAIGVSIQSRAEAPGADVVRNINQFFDIMILDRMQIVGNIFQDSFTTFEASGRHPARNPLIRDQLIRAFAPRTLYRFASFTEDRALKSLRTGNRLIDDVSLLERLAFTFGLVPLKIEKGFEAQGVLWSNQERMRRLTTEFGRELSTLFDREKASGPEIRDLYSRAIEAGLSPSGIYKSARTQRANRIGEDLIERQFDSSRARAIKESLGVK